MWGSLERGGNPLEGARALERGGTCSRGPLIGPLWWAAGATAAWAVPCVRVSYGPPWAHYLGGYQDRLLGGPLGLPGLRYTAPDGVEHKDYGGEVLG
jgi:hypothetical protein